MDTRYPVSASGRWSGQITRRPLPASAPSLRGLAPAHRRMLADLWTSQAATEHRVSASFGVVHRALVESHADAGLIAIAARAVDDEMRHAALCCAMAERYAGCPVAAPPALPLAHPTHPDARTPALRRALYVVGQCALNETFASAFLEASLASAEAPLARAALRELLSDEVDHARIGWAFVATLAPEVRADLASWLLPLAVCNLREWRSLSLPIEPRGVLAAHGVPAPHAVEAALRDALASIIIPGFARFGLPVDPLARWLAAGAPTPAVPRDGG